jgi:hypothetical protein
VWMRPVHVFLAIVDGLSSRAMLRAGCTQASSFDRVPHARVDDFAARHRAVAEKRVVLSSKIK